MKSIYNFLILYFSINFVFFIASEFFGIRILLIHSLIVQAVIFLIVFLITRKDLVRSNKILVFLLFFLLGGAVFFISIFGAVYKVYEFLIVAYLISTAFLVWKSKMRKFFWIPILILVIQIGSLFVSSGRCNLNYKGGFVYSCDCKGLLKSSGLATNCVGERTCYKYSEKVEWTRGDMAEKKEVNCSEIDNYNQHPEVSPWYR